MGGCIKQVDVLARGDCLLSFHLHCIYIPPCHTPITVCTKIGSPQALGQVLVDTDLPFNSLCKGLDLPDTTCSSLADEAPPLGKLAKKYMEQNPSSCWESIVKALCRKLAKKDLAKIVAKKHGVSDYSTLC